MVLILATLIGYLVFDFAGNGPVTTVLPDKLWK